MRKTDKTIVSLHQQSGSLCSVCGVAILNDEYCLTIYNLVSLCPKCQKKFMKELNIGYEMLSILGSTPKL